MNMSSKDMEITRTNSARRLATFGIVSAILSFILIPEVFGPIAIILGAYAWKKEPDSSLGLITLVFGLVCMLASIEIFGPTLWYFLPPF